MVTILDPESRSKVFRDMTQAVIAVLEDNSEVIIIAQTAPVEVKPLQDTLGIPTTL